MDDLSAFRTATDRLRDTARQVQPEDLSRPTPCPEWDVRGLLGHVVAGQDGLVAVLRGQQPDWSRDALGDDPVAAVERSLDDAVRAWSEPGALDRRSEQLPGLRVVDFALADAVAHGWDLAAALGRPLGLPDDVAQLVLERWSAGAAETGRTYGAFGPAVEVDASRPPLDRLVALFGRDPDRRDAA